MKHVKWPLLIAAPYSLVLLDVLLYRGGGPLSITVFLLLVPLLYYLFYSSTKKVFAFLLLCLNMGLASLLASYLSTRLYYHNVSNDGMTPTVGMFLAFLGLAVIALFTLALMITKAIANRDREKKAPAEDAENRP